MDSPTTFRQTVAAPLATSKGADPQRGVAPRRRREWNPRDSAVIRAARCVVGMRGSIRDDVDGALREHL